MKLGLQIPYFTWPGGAPEMGPKLAQIAHEAENAGYDSIWVMDHHFQIPMVGPAETDMLEAYTTLGFIAAHTSRATLGTMVTGVTYRNPGILVKQVTTLDVLSGGRAWLGIGAAWFEREHDGLGVRFPPLKERFERLDEALQIANQMWNSDNNGAFQGKHYQLKETLNVPESLSRPHPRILIGGSGERKTLRLVAKYADACNIFAQSPEFVKHKLDVLREHCEREGRNYNDIEKTVLTVMAPGPNGENAAHIVDQFGKLAEIGVQTAIGAVVGVENLTPLEAMGRDVIPQVTKFGAKVGV
jgi:F420-dependent oxidoreductase-like protein